MKKILGFIIVLCLAFIGAVYYVGISAQKKTEGDLDKMAFWLAANAPEVKITNRSYQKGFLTSTSSFSVSAAGDPETIAGRLACGAMRDIKAFSSLMTSRQDEFCRRLVGSTLGLTQSDSTPLTLAINTSIKHGPWLGGSDFGRASSKTQFALTSNPTGETNAYLKTWFESIVLNSVEGFGKDLKTHLSVPAFDSALLGVAQLDEQVSSKMKGLNVYMNTESGRKFVNFKIESLGVESKSYTPMGFVSSTVGQQVVIMGNRPVNGSIEDWLFNGADSGVSSDVQYQMLGQTLDCKNMKWNSIGKLNSGLFDGNVKFDFDCAATVDADHIPLQGVLDWSMSKVNMTAFMGIMQNMLETRPSEEVVIEKLAEMTRAMPTMSGNTTLTMNGKKVLTSTHLVELKGMTANSLRNFLATEMLQSLTADVSVVLYPQDLGNALPESQKRVAGQMLTQLESSGAFVKNNEELKFDFAVKNGKVLLNGKEQPL